MSEGERDNKLSGIPSYMDTDSIESGSQIYDLILSLITFLKAPSLNIATPELELQHMNFGVTQTFSP